MHAERLTSQEQKLLFKRWGCSKSRPWPNSRILTVKDIAEAYEMTPPEVYRQLQELRSEQAQAIAAAGKRRQTILALTVRCLPAVIIVTQVSTLITAGSRPVKHVSSTDLSGTTVSLAEQQDSLGSQFYQAKQFQDAEREYLKAVQLNPKIPLYHND